MNVSTDTWLSLALQIPLALVIVFLVIKFLDHLKAVHSETLTFIREQSIVNQDFIKTQREANNAATEHLARELSSMKLETIKELSTLTSRVDKTIEHLLVLDSKMGGPRK